MTRLLLFVFVLAAPLWAQDGGCGTVGPISSPLTGAAMPSTEPVAPPAIDQKLPATIETATFGLG